MELNRGPVQYSPDQRRDYWGAIVIMCGFGVAASCVVVHGVAVGSAVEVGAALTGGTGGMISAGIYYAKRIDSDNWHS